jgi:hypothetical protein
MKPWLLLAVLTVVSSVTAQPTGTIVVYRPHAKMAGIALKPSIYVDGVQVVRICNGCFFSTTLPAGKHIVTIGRSEVGQFIEVTDQTIIYFKVRGKKSAMITGAQPMVLDPVRKVVALKEMDRLKSAE